MSAQNIKKELRKEIAFRKKALSPEFFHSESANILHRLEDHPLFINASCIALYHALPDEVQTAAFIEKWHTSKTILLPVIAGSDILFFPYCGKEKLQTGAYGIHEPTRKISTPLPPIDLAIIPGIAFDRNLNRMGRGKGYYDRFLSATHIPKIGICFSCQLIDSIPTEPFDIPMDIIITEKEIIEKKSPSGRV